MANVPLRNDIVAALSRHREEKAKRTGVHVTYSDVVLELLDKKD